MRDLEPCVPGDARIVARIRNVEKSSLSKQPDSPGLHWREAETQEDEEAKEEDEKKEEKKKEAGVEETREGRQYQGGGTFPSRCGRCGRRGRENVRL